MTKISEKWDEKKYPTHMQMDVQTRNENIDKDLNLCSRCEGTGNELYSMYHKCTSCNGSGATP